MKKYQGYTDAGLPWAQPIPMHWKLLRNKVFLQEREEKSTKGKETLLSLSQYTGISIKGNDTDKTGMYRAESLIGYKVVHTKDIVMNIMLAWNGSTARSRHDGIISPAYAVYKVISDVANPDYLHYISKTPQYMKYFETFSTGIIKSRLRLYPQTFLHLYTIIPPREEQDQIVRFLDWKVSEINRLISIKNKQIQMLKEREKQIISDTVLHGLHNAVLKDSGNRWIGVIPTDWDVIKLGRFCSFQNGISESGDFFTSGTPFVGYGDVYRHLELPEIVSGVAQSSEDQQEVFSVREGDIFFTRTSESIEEVGMAAVCKHTIEKAVFSGFLIRCRPRIALLNIDYVKYYLQIPAIRNHFSSMMNIVIRASLSQNLLKQMPVIIPPMNEQEEIALYLDTQHSKHLALIETIQKEINALDELKTRLISDVVTGKIDVRDIEVPDFEYVEEETGGESEENVESVEGESDEE